MIEPFKLTPPPDDTPPAPPDFPEPIRESGARAMVGLAQSARGALAQALARLAHHYPQPVADVTGRGMIVLGTGNVPISSVPATIEPGPPFSISLFTDDDDNERWLPAPSSLLAFDGEIFFAAFQPTLENTPISSLTTETAPAMPADGLQAWLRIEWEVYTDRPAVPREPIYAVRVTAVQVLLLGYEDAAPEDDIKEGITHRPWFKIGPPEDGVRPLVYQTLGYAHFWLYLRVVGEPVPSESSSSPSSSSDPSPPSHQACFGVRMGGRLCYPTWGMLLRPAPILRCTISIALTPGHSRVVSTLPAEWLGSVGSDSTRVVHAHATVDTDEPVIVTIEGNDIVAFCPRPLRKRQRRLLVQIEGLLAGHDGEYRWTDEAGREHNRKFWTGGIV